MCPQENPLKLKHSFNDGSDNGLNPILSPLKYNILKDFQLLFRHKMESSSF